MRVEPRLSPSPAPLTLPLPLQQTFVTKKNLTLLILAGIALTIGFVAVGLIREAQWRGKIHAVKMEATNAIAAAAQIAQREHYGKKNIAGDVKSLGNLVKSVKNIDGALNSANAKIAASSGKTKVKNQATVEKDIAGTKLLGVDPAIKAVIRAVERDVAGANGHPLMLQDGKPMSKTNKEIDVLANKLEEAEKEIEEDERENEVDSEKIATLPPSAKPGEKKDTEDAIKERKAEVKTLEKLQENLVEAIAVVAKGKL